MTRLAESNRKKKIAFEAEVMQIGPSLHGLLGHSLSWTEERNHLAKLHPDIIFPEDQDAFNARKKKLRARFSEIAKGTGPLLQRLKKKSLRFFFEIRANSFFSLLN